MSASASRFRRAQQWLQFHRQWHVIDAANQACLLIMEFLNTVLTQLFLGLVQAGRTCWLLSVRQVETDLASGN
jgi:hypothetical protein